LIICEFCQEDFKNKPDLSENINLNTIDSFIEEGGFGKTFIAVFSLPKLVKQRLEDVS